MAWKLTYNQDTEIKGVGTATAVYTDAKGDVLVTHSDRIDERDGNTIGGFIDEALAKYEKANAAVSTEIPAILAKIQAVLDDKVGK